MVEGHPPRLLTKEAYIALHLPLHQPSAGPPPPVGEE
jgi:hypothetical protein